MSKKKPPRKPDNVVINGIPYTLILFEITAKFPNGTPRHCARIPDQATVLIATTPPKEFFTAYVQTSMLRK